MHCLFVAKLLFEKWLETIEVAWFPQVVDNIAKDFEILTCFIKQNYYLSGWIEIQIKQNSILIPMSQSHYNLKLEEKK